MMANDMNEDKSAKIANAQKGIAEQISMLKTDISGLAKEVTDLTKHKVDEAVSDVKETANEKVDDLTAAIRKQPMQATAIAVGIGFVFGLLLSR